MTLLSKDHHPPVQSIGRKWACWLWVSHGIVVTGKGRIIQNKNGFLILYAMSLYGSIPPVVIMKNMHIFP